jgi:hypothetical protein
MEPKSNNLDSDLTSFIGSKKEREGVKEEEWNKKKTEENL